jgi:putative transposase
MPPPARGTRGTQRSLLTAAGGVPSGLAVAGAKRHDVKRVLETRTSLPVECPRPTPEPPQGRSLDTGEDVEDVRALRALCGCPAHLRARGEKAPASTRVAGDKARRWGVERPPRGMNRCRHVLVRGDKKMRNVLAFLHLACASITYKRSGLLG